MVIPSTSGDLVITSQRMICAAYRNLDRPPGAEAASLISELHLGWSAAIYELPWERVASVSRRKKRSLWERFGQRGQYVKVDIEARTPLSLEFDPVNVLTPPPDLAPTRAATGSEVMGAIVEAAAEFHQREGANREAGGSMGLPDDRYQLVDGRLVARLLPAHPASRVLEAAHPLPIFTIDTGN